MLDDPVSGRARYAVVQVDKAWELNDPEIAVPWGAFKITKKGEKEAPLTGKTEPQFEFALDATKEKLADAPRYKVGDADRLFTREAGADLSVLVHLVGRRTDAARKHAMIHAD